MQLSQIHVIEALVYWESSTQHFESVLFCIVGETHPRPPDELKQLPEPWPFMDTQRWQSPSPDNSAANQAHRLSGKPNLRGKFI